MVIFDIFVQKIFKGMMSDFSDWTSPTACRTVCVFGVKNDQKNRT